MANTWNQAGTTWGQNQWGQQAEPVVDVTGVSLSASIGAVEIDARIEQGWGRGTWNQWAWGVDYSVEPAGLQANFTLGSVIVGESHTVDVSGVSSTFALGTLDVRGNSVHEHATGVQANFTLGEPIIFENEAVDILAGVEATFSVGTTAIIGGLDVNLTGFQLTASLGEEAAFTDITIYPAGLSITSSLGEVQQVSKYNVYGEGLTSAIGSVTTVNTANIDLTGVSITASVGNGTAFAWAPNTRGPDITWTEQLKSAA